MRLHHTEVSPIYFQEGAPLTRAFGGKNKNTNHHSKCTCYFPSGVRDWIASESREKAADGPVWSLSPARSGERGRDLAQGAGLCEGRRALEEPSCQMPDAARAAVLAAPAAPCPSGKQPQLSACSALPQLRLRGARGPKACGYCFVLCRRASWSPRSTVSASQSYQEAR